MYESIARSSALCGAPGGGAQLPPTHVHCWSQEPTVRWVISAGPAPRPQTWPAPTSLLRDSFLLVSSSSEPEPPKFGRHGQTVTETPGWLRLRTDPSNTTDEKG